MAGGSSTSIVELIPMPAEVRPTCFRYALSAGVLRRDGPGLTQGAGRGDPSGRRAARGSFAIMPDHLVRLARLRAPGMRCALHWASGARRLEAGVKEVEQTSSAAAGECDGRFDTGKGRGSRAASSRRPWRAADLATRPVQAGRPQTLVEAAQTFVERPILLGTRFEIPGVGRGLNQSDL